MTLNHFSFGLLFCLIAAHANAAAWTCSAYCGGRNSGGGTFVIDYLPVAIGTGATSDEAYTATLSHCSSLLHNSGHTPTMVKIFSSRLNPKPNSAWDTQYSEALVADICVKN